MRVEMVVFTRDLRVRDHPALAAACAGADAVVPLFVLDAAVLARHRAPARLAYLAGALADLDRSLRARGGRLEVRRGPFVATVLAAALDSGAAAVHLSADVSAFAELRTRRLAESLAAHSIELIAHPGVTVVPPGALEPAGGGEFKVFTPYWKRWIAAPWRPIVPAPERVAVPRTLAEAPLPLPHELTGEALVPPTVAGGESAATAAFRAWARTRLAAYPATRDDLAADATSHISAALHFGCLSPLEVATRLRDRAGGAPFVRQLCWRDFFAQVLSARPDAAHRDYRDRGIRWDRDAQALAAWKGGLTGFPIVDAAMRQLSAEGFVHNRARMIVASFLTKDLAIDWRLGAAHFMDHLVDGDIASNQLSWQWVAGTGTDTNPHRIFNPTVQSKRFDASGDYVRRYVAELRDVPAPEIHEPGAQTRASCGYPPPIVDHSAAVARYRALLGA